MSSHEDVAATTAPEGERNSRARIGGWIRFGIITLVAAFAIIRLVLTRDYSWIGVLLALTIAAVLLTTVAALSRFRLSVLRKRFPGSFLAQVEVYSQLSSQLATLNSALADGGKYVRSLRYATLVVDADEVRLYGGVSAPKLLFSIPVENLVQCRIAIAPQGKYNWASLELVMRAGDRDYPVDLCLIRFDWGVSRPLRRATLDARLEAVRAITGIKG